MHRHHYHHHNWLTSGQASSWYSHWVLVFCFLCTESHTPRQHQEPVSAYTPSVLLTHWRTTAPVKCIPGPNTYGNFCVRWPHTRCLGTRRLSSWSHGGDCCRYCRVHFKRPTAGWDTHTHARPGMFCLWVCVFCSCSRINFGFLKDYLNYTCTLYDTLRRNFLLLRRIPSIHVRVVF